MTNRLFLLTSAILIPVIFARGHYDEAVKKKAHTQPRSAAECAPATTIGYMRFNSVNALIETGGSMWQDRQNGAAAYEVPKNSGKTAIYSGSLWMGGTDANGQLKIAAVTFRQGTNDFWTGPLTNDGSAEVTPDVCSEYDRFFSITRQQVVEFIDWWNCTKGPAPSTDCADRDFGTYSIPRVILEWPAHGDASRGQDPFLAPFFDNNAFGVPNGVYDPENDGDYPYYDLYGAIDCRAVRDIRLFGDSTCWWVFNDKGNIHTETNGQSIGMEIRAQAFAFSTNDEVNDMTFYNYELINRSSFTLENTYFGQWVDPDVGCADDDYVGCDVERGLGFCYNGDNFDEDCRGAVGYGSLPSAIGIDFFEGPYQDNDGINNAVGIGPNEALNGVGYQDTGATNVDSIIDNERFGMRRFVYYDRGTSPTRGDAVTALHHYNYLRSIWKDGAKMVFGGNGHPTDPGATDIEADFMFPGASDPRHWGTRGEDPGFSWTEITAGNPPFDRRFIQSAGPFTLMPGAVNDITVGVVWAQSTDGNSYTAVERVVTADTKAQALFDNCFDVLDGPDSPDLSGVELNREIILFLTNRKGVSNNYKKVPGDYEEVDPFIVTPDGQPEYDNKYRFQGYLIYQLANSSVTVSELDNTERARLIFQCDIKDNVGDLINFVFDEELNASVPQYMVKDAGNDGINTTFRVTTDQFSISDPRLVNFKTYYFMAVSYAYNNYKDYIPDNILFLDGQKLPYLASRKSSSGAIETVSFTPHPHQPTGGGMRINSIYGDQPEITRIEGQGNGGNPLAFTPATLEDLIANSKTPGMNQPTYRRGAGPIKVKVIDPTNVQGGSFTLRMYLNSDSVMAWKAWHKSATSGNVDTVYSETPIAIENEQIVPDWGVSIAIGAVEDPNSQIGQSTVPDQNYNNGYISSSIEYADSSKVWLTGIDDVTGTDNQNWIRSGTTTTAVASPPDPSHPEFYDSYFRTISTIDYAIDPLSIFEGILGGTFSPWRLLSFSQQQDNAWVRHAPAPGNLNGASVKSAYLQNLQSVVLVITSDQNKWTRCPVIEMQDEDELSVGNAVKGRTRLSPSVDKDGNEEASGTGMGWFPGYAINLETGERLNMAFGEDSWLGDQNGADMLWNPTSVESQGIGGSPDNVRWGGKHYIYIFGKSSEFSQSSSIVMTAYDEGAALYSKLNGSETDLVAAWTTCLWAGIPMVEEGKELLATDVTIHLQVEKPYKLYESDSLQNNGMPMYRWNMSDFETDRNVSSVATDALSMIRVVPNPYYAFAEHYEQDQLDNFVKITNLPERCTISIYNVSGTLVRKFNKSNPSTEQRWDLQNQERVPIAGGLYLIHIDAPGVGETIVKWFGVLRPVDLRGF